MNDFTASNGKRIVLTNAGQSGYVAPDLFGGEVTGFLDFADYIAWREFFQAEADERLGRWRWPENPDYVVYALEKIGMEGVKVVHETDGFQQSFETRSQAAKRPGSIPAQAAVAYFDAHPEPKPEWHDAKPGEVWVFEYTTGPSMTASFTSRRDGEWVGAVSGLPVSLTDVVAGRRIWPKDAS